MKLFIDTNIYLNYFRSADADVSSLSELKSLLESKKLKLVLPAQTRDEYFRNRNRIAEQSREVLYAASELKLTFPAPFVKKWPEATRVRKRVEATKKAYKKLLEKYDDMVSKERTPADVLIRYLFGAAEVLVEDEESLRKAYFRYLRGHPPRKNDGSFGDAIAWELLLAQANDDLVVVTKDSDFTEKRRGIISLNGFLKREWDTRYKKKKSIDLYVSLGQFVNTFEKREAVSDEVVQKEKAPTYAILNYPLTSNNVAIGTNTSNSVFLPASGTIIGNTANPLFITGATSIFGNNANSFFTEPLQASIQASNVNSVLGVPGVINAANTAGLYYSGPGVLTAGNVAFVRSAGSASSGKEAGLSDAAERCPHCHNDLTSARAAFSKGASSGSNKFRCPNCDSEV